MTFKMDEMVYGMLTIRKRITWQNGDKTNERFVLVKRASGFTHALAKGAFKTFVSEQPESEQQFYYAEWEVKTFL